MPLEFSYIYYGTRQQEPVQAASKQTCSSSTELKSSAVIAITFRLRSNGPQYPGSSALSWHMSSTSGLVIISNDIEVETDCGMLYSGTMKGSEDIGLKHMVLARAGYGELAERSV